MYRLHTNCRACGNPILFPVVDLGWQVPANNFVMAEYTHQGAAPLKLLFCEQCTLAQLSAVVDPETLYSNYKYVTGTNPELERHFRKLWEAIVGRCRCPSDYVSVMEIGSNTGEFLLNCIRYGAIWVVGIEPAMNLARISKRRGLPTVRAMFKEKACPITESKPSVIVARHVFCHMDDWQDFVSALDKCSNTETLIVIEVPYVLDTLQRCEWDQLYHEHLSYLSLKAMVALLDDSPFQICDVLRFPIHGGTIALFIKRKPCDVQPVVAEMVAAENITVQDWYVFASKARRRADNLRMTVGAHLASKKVVGFGASAKSSVWIQACGFTRNDIRFICDNTPQKQGRLSPGTDIPIVPESELTNENADYAILFSWNWAEVIIPKHQKWIDGGGRFILPHEV